MQRGLAHPDTGTASRAGGALGQRLPVGVADDWRRAPTGLVLEIDVGERLPVLISGDETIQGGGKRRAVGME